MGALPLCQLSFLPVDREWLRDATRQGRDQEPGELPDDFSPCSPSTEEDGMTADITVGTGRGTGDRYHSTRLLVSTEVASQDSHWPLPVPGAP